MKAIFIFILIKVFKMEDRSGRERQPRFRWKDKLKVDMLERNLLEHKVWDRHEW